MFSIAQLLLPISAERACGDDVAFSPELDAIARARTCDDPTLDQGEWVAELKEADWGFVASRCAAMLAAHSKDMRLAVWLAEAHAKTRGLRGLGDGYAVLTGLCEHYWDGLYPLADDGDYDQRVGNLFWLLNRTPVLVGEMLFEGGLAPQDDTEYCIAMLGDLERVTDLRLGADGPGFAPAREALQALVRGRAPLGHLAQEAGVAPASWTPGVASSACMAGQPRDRAQALQQLRLVADFFRRTEPHSPVAYLADKAASWGDMPLHLWLRAVIKDTGAIAGVEELLGSASSDK